MRLLFVCTGNICRSPTAEAVFRKRLADAGLAAVVTVDSAGTQSHHAGHPPDARAQAAAKARGYDLSRLRARRLTVEDFERFDLLLAMDEGHFNLMHRVAPPGTRDKVKMLLDYTRAVTAASREVPDPYYGAPDGFEQVLDLVEAASVGLLEYVRDELSIRSSSGQK